METQTHSRRQQALLEWKKKYLPRRAEQEARDKLQEHTRKAGKALADKKWQAIFQRDSRAFRPICHIELNQDLIANVKAKRMETQAQSRRQQALLEWKRKYFPRRVEQEERDKLQEHTRKAGKALADKKWRAIFQNR